MSRWLMAVVLSACATDPASIWATRAAARSLDCRRITQAEATSRYPGVVPEPSVRGTTFSDTDAVVCERQWLNAGERPARDEAILATLSASVSELVTAANALEPNAKATWFVDAFYPDARVASKIAVAARVGLVERGRAVSDRVPLLAAGDVAVLGRMPVPRSFPVACARYFAEKTLADPQVFLGLMIIDSREAELHAGVCARGSWRWLR
jgi:hypothetical protein